MWVAAVCLFRVLTLTRCVIWPPCCLSPCHRDKNAFKTINAAPGSAVAKAAAASLDPSNTADVFSRRHTQSKVYWATGRGKAAAADAAGGEAGGLPQQPLQRTASGAADVELLKGSLKKMEPSELIKVGGWKHRAGCQGVCGVE